MNKVFIFLLLFSASFQSISQNELYEADSIKLFHGNWYANETGRNDGKAARMNLSQGGGEYANHFSFIYVHPNKGARVYGQCLAETDNSLICTDMETEKRFEIVRNNSCFITISQYNGSQVYKIAAISERPCKEAPLPSPMPTMDHEELVRYEIEKERARLFDEANLRLSAEPFGTDTMFYPKKGGWQVMYAGSFHLTEETIAAINEEQKGQVAFQHIDYNDRFGAIVYKNLTNKNIQGLRYTVIRNVDEETIVKQPKKRPYNMGPPSDAIRYTFTLKVPAYSPDTIFYSSQGGYQINISQKGQTLIEGKAHLGSKLLNEKWTEEGLAQVYEAGNIPHKPGVWALVVYNNTNKDLELTYKLTRDALGELLYQRSKMPRPFSLYEYNPNHKLTLVVKPGEPDTLYYPNTSDWKVITDGQEELTSEEKQEFIRSKPNWFSIIDYDEYTKAIIYHLPGNFKPIKINYSVVKVEDGKQVFQKEKYPLMEYGF